jgi:hypothetical protein
VPKLRQRVTEGLRGSPPERERKAVEDRGVGLTMTELNERLRDTYDSQPTKVMCGVDGCDWPGLEATAAECRDAAREHRESAHPELAEQDRKKHRAKEQARDRAERSAEKRRDMVAADADADQREDEPLPRTKRRYRFWNEESATEAFKAFEQRTGTPPGAADLATDPELPSFGTVKKLFGSLDAAVEKIWPQAVYPAAPNGNEHVEAPLPDLTAGELAGLREVENEVESELAEAVRERLYEVASWLESAPLEEIEERAELYELIARNAAARARGWRQLLEGVRRLREAAR